MQIVHQHVKQPAGASRETHWSDSASEWHAAAKPGSTGTQVVSRDMKARYNICTLEHAVPTQEYDSQC